MSKMVVTDKSIEVFADVVDQHQLGIFSHDTGRLRLRHPNAHLEDM